jgi:hypothetical protein
VLSGVLLHVIQSAQPVDSAFDKSTYVRRPSLDYVQHAFFLIVDTLHHPQSIKGAGVAGLASTSWVESRTVQSDRRPSTHAFGPIDNARVEFDQMGILIVETFGWGHDELIMQQ